MDIKVGNAVPLVAQIECPESGILYYVRAFIYDSSNTLLSTRDLIDRGHGRFENFSYIMPNLSLITVQYRVFDDATYTTELEDPCPGTEVFTKLEELAGGGGDLIPVSAKGLIIRPIIRARIAAPLLRGRVVKSISRGRVRSRSAIIGRVFNKTLKGILSCK